MALGPGSRHRFRICIGIDWSGAAEYRPSSKDHPEDYPIQVALVRTDDGAAKLSKPDGEGSHWTRSRLCSFLIEKFSEHVDDPRPVVVGFDFAFGLPFVDRGSYFPDLSGAPDTWLDLLGMIRARATPENDFVPSGVVSDEGYGEYFLHQDRKGSHYEERYRKTDQRSLLYGERCSSVFKMVGAGQVGKGSVAGMAFLAELKAKLGPRIHIWPFDGLKWSPEVRAVIVEVYPRIMYRLCDGDASARDNFMRFGHMLTASGLKLARPPEGPPYPSFGDNSADALVTAAALHRFADDGRPWAGPYSLGKKVYQVEGWIWGAGAFLTDHVDADYKREQQQRVAALEAALRGGAVSPQADHRFWLLRGLLGGVASARQTITYKEAAALCGLYTEELYPYLKQIQQNPMGEEPDLSAIVIGAQGRPGNAWNTKYEWKKETQARWERVRDEVFEAWSVRRELLVDQARDPADEHDDASEETP